MDGSQTNRLLFYKALLTSKLFVPITTDSPDDPNSLIYTFPIMSMILLSLKEPYLWLQQCECFNQQIGNLV